MGSREESGEKGGGTEVCEPKKKPPRSRPRRLLISIIRITIISYLGLAIVLLLFQKYLVFRPYEEIEGTPDLYGMQYEDASFTTADGITLCGWYVPGDEDGKTILFCHGNAGNISHRLDSIDIFHRLGASVFIFDYRGYGQSKGRPSEKGTYQDARAAWDYLVEAKKVDPERIVIFGRSLGGAVAANLATQRTPSALILESTFTSAPDLGAGIYPYLPVRWLCRFSYDTKSMLPEIDCPILIVHSRDDEMIKFSHAEQLYQAAKQPKQLFELSGSHNEGIFTSHTEYVNTLRNFLANSRDGPS